MLLVKLRCGDHPPTLTAETEGAVHAQLEIIAGGSVQKDHQQSTCSYRSSIIIAGLFILSALPLCFK